MSTNPTTIKDGATSPSRSNPNCPPKHRQITARARAKRSRPKELQLASINEPPTKNSVRQADKSSKASKLPPIPEFGCHRPSDQLAEFRDWMKLVRAALRFAPDWDDHTTADWFEIVCGKNLRLVISAFQLEPIATETPFSALIENLENHFKSITDPALEHQALQSCTQGTTESAADFFVKLSQLTRYMGKSESEIRTHFVMNLRDKNFRNLAVTNDWNLRATVAAATRNESMMGSVSHPAQGEIAAVTIHRPTDRHRPPNRYRTDDSNARTPMKRQSAPTHGYTRTGPDRQGDRQCKDCGITRHRTNVCPAIGKQCSICKKPNHFAAVCPDAQRRDRPDRAQARYNKPASVNQVSIEEDWDV